MPMIGRPKQPKALPKSLPADAVTALLAAVSAGPQRPRSTDWLERDRALIITGLLAGLRADETAARQHRRPAPHRLTAPSFRSAAKATKTAGSPSKPSSSTSSITTLTAERHASRAPPSVAPPPPGDLPAGRRPHRCSSVATANASPVGTGAYGGICRQVVHTGRGQSGGPASGSRTAALASLGAALASLAQRGTANGGDGVSGYIVPTDPTALAQWLLRQGVGGPRHCGHRGNRHRRHQRVTTRRALLS